MYYFSWGGENSPRPPILLIHGAGGTHLSWPPQVRRLGGQWIHALDLPGHGRSGGVGRQTVGAYAADVLRWMDALRMPAAVLAGHSMGAAIALTLALEHPRRVLALALLGAAPRMRVAPAFLEGLEEPSSFRATTERITGTSYSLRADSRLKELAARRLAETRPPVLHGDLLACDLFDVSADLPRIHVPTLVLASEEDRMVPVRFSRLLQEQIPGAQLRLISGGGHMFMLEQPETVASALIDFLDTLPDRPIGPPESP
jgi:pimeloyl-ACP methyl ester carboxylesterase